MRKWDNYVNSLNALEKAPEQNLQNEFIQSGIIDKFSLQFELGWKLMKKMLSWEGDPVSSTGSPRDVIKTAFKYYSFMDEKTWLDMLRDRNNISHVYDKESALGLIGKILNVYIGEFENLRVGFENRYGDLLTGPEF